MEMFRLCLYSGLHCIKYNILLKYEVTISRRSSLLTCLVTGWSLSGTKTGSGDTHAGVITPQSQSVCCHWRYWDVTSHSHLQTQSRPGVESEGNEDPAWPALPGESDCTPTQLADIEINAWFSPHDNVNITTRYIVTSIRLGSDIFQMTFRPRPRCGPGERRSRPQSVSQVSAGHTDLAHTRGTLGHTDTHRQ